ncbi:MAG: flippase [Candidatus Magasanikbacteria bacterium]|jgi:O-antigen/teichoic acid export membrane protein
MSTTRSIAVNTAVQIVGKGISTLLGLLAVGIMTRALGAEQFGYYATAIGFLQFFAILCDFGFIVNTAKLLSEPNFDKKSLLNNLFTWRLITAVVFQAIAIGALWALPYRSEIKIAGSILALSYVANILNQVFTGYYQTKLKMATVMAGEIIGRTLLVVGIYLVAFYHYGLLSMMGVVTGAAWVYTIYLWVKSDGVRLAYDRAISQTIFQKMWPTALAIIFNAFYLQGDRVLLPLYDTPAHVGFYSAAYRVLDIMAQVGFMTMGVLVPLLSFSWARNLKNDFAKYYQLSFDLMLLLLLPMVAGTIALAEPIMRLVAGPEFSDAGQILALLSISMLGICFGTTYSMIAIAIDRQHRSTWIFFATAILAVGAYLIFIPRYGMQGAAYVTIGSELFAGAGLFILCARETKLWPKVWTGFKILIASAVMGVIVYRLQPLNIFLSIVIGKLIYLSLIALFRVISKQTITELLTNEQIEVAQTSKF